MQKKIMGQNMLNIIIIGENSYIGNSFEDFAREKFNIKKVSSRGNAWKSADFSGCGCVLYCAGIAHVKNAGNTLYFTVNCDLALEIAKKAKAEGVVQFIYLSSAAVYNYNNQPGEINADTPAVPLEAYGQSKLKAENELKKLQNHNFLVTLIRPPMVYGAGCRGNFQRLLKLAKIFPVFPDINNRRSMIYIDNLSYFIAWAVQNRQAGIFFPQNAQHVNTSGLFKSIRAHLDKKTHLTRIFNPGIRLFSKRISTLDKLFGDFAYIGAECENIDYIGFEESVKRSVRGFTSRP
jgi:UDP-glucose 4-epimerase